MELQILNSIPIPGVKLGLANVITVYAVYHYWAKEVLLVIFVQIFLGVVFGGNMMALLYSLAGGMLCFVGMLFLRRVIFERYIWLCSVFGVVLHNIGQILVVILITGSLAIIAYLPFLLVSGCLAGAFTGGCAQLGVKRSKDIHWSIED